MLKQTIKIKELIHSEVCMGTYGLVELELLEIEKQLNCKPENFESNLFKAINNHCQNGLKKPDLIRIMNYVLKSCELS